MSSLRDRPLFVASTRHRWHESIFWIWQDGRPFVCDLADSRSRKNPFLHYTCKSSNAICSEHWWLRLEICVFVAGRDKTCLGVSMISYYSASGSRFGNRIIAATSSYDRQWMVMALVLMFLSCCCVCILHWFIVQNIWNGWYLCVLSMLENSIQRCILFNDRNSFFHGIGSHILLEWQKCQFRLLVNGMKCTVQKWV